MNDEEAMVFIRNLTSDVDEWQRLRSELGTVVLDEQEDSQIWKLERN